MEDFSNDLFSSFFDDPVLDEKSPLLDMELDSPTPGIQAEHSYSLSGDSAPQSPIVPIKMEDTTQGKKGWQGPGYQTQGGTPDPEEGHQTQRKDTRPEGAPTKASQSSPSPFCSSASQTQKGISQEGLWLT